jgi:hypothetical protein
MRFIDRLTYTGGFDLPLTNGALKGASLSEVLLIRQLRACCARKRRIEAKRTPPASRGTRSVRFARAAA